ncbi:MAG TPA: ATP synthase F1 subunit epsilon [Candidatus Binataceae bacterium]|nr:ATP synthase F1 subunit epsilon [Candidatus Binataceae bacterium]
MAETFPLQLVTPIGIAYEGEVEEVTAWNPLGQFGVLAEHINFITSLVPGVVEIRLPGGAMRYFVVAGGLAEVKDGKMTILADSAEEPGKIDVTAVEIEIREVEGKIASISMYAEEFETTQHDLLLARARHRAGTELRTAR